MIVKLDDFTRDIHKNGHIASHIRAFSGRSTIGKFDGSVTGIERFYCPPITAQKLSFTMKMELLSHGVTVYDNARTGHGIGYQIKLLAENWHPSYIYRKGIMHEYLGSGKELGMNIETRVIPSMLDDSFYLEMVINNFSSEALEFILSPDWKENKIADGTGLEWGWTPPCSEKEAQKIGDGVYFGEGVYMSLLWSNTGKCADGIKISLGVGETQRIVLKVAFDLNCARKEQCDIVREMENSLEMRQSKWDEFWELIPHFESSCPALDRAYLHSMLILFLIKWESPHFIFSPFYAEAGLCGRSVCAYTWGESYISKVMMLVDKENYKKNIIAHLFMGLDEHYAVDPITGNGIGPCYNYNLHSVITVVRDYVNITKDKSFLAEEINGVPLYRLLVNLVKDIESKSTKYGELLDYGDHHNLLEMRGSGYEHIVPSPNGERVVIYRYIAEILSEFGHTDEANEFIKASDAVKEDLTKQLWDEDAGWFKCKYPDGHEELVYSIQIFDLLGSDIVSDEQENAIIAHINEDEFLSEHGIHGVSKADMLHFDLGDVDWSGAGAYSGDPCNLVEVLFRMGRTEKAWDAAKRILWWSEKYPYWPQAIWAGKQEYSHWETPICKCGVAFAQAVLYGMLGMKFENGEVSFDAHIPAEITKVELTNVKAFGKVHGFSTEK